jgi:hypothetical protein
MDPVGRVLEILSDRLVLVAASDHLSTDEIVTVFSRAPATGELQSKYQLTNLDIPKGELRVLIEQKPGLFLLEAFQETRERTERVHPTDVFLSGVMGFEVRNTSVLGPPSATLSDPTLPVPFAKSVMVGDYIARHA